MFWSQYRKKRSYFATEKIISNDWQIYHENNEPASRSNSSHPHCLGKGWLSYSCYRVLFQIRSIGCKLWPRSLLFILKAHAVPVVGKTCRFSLPVLQECHSLEYLFLISLKLLWFVCFIMLMLTPKRHKHSIKYSSWMIKQVGYSGIITYLMERPCATICT